MHYDAVFLDFEGTLAFMAPPHAQIYVDACAACGVAITRQDLRRVIDEGWRQFETPYGVRHEAYSATPELARELRRLVHAERLRALGMDAATAALAAAAVAEEEVRPAYYRWYPDALPTLAELARRGLRLCVVSNHMWELPEIIAALGCNGLDLPAVTSARAGCRKPFPDIYHQALDLLDVEPERTLFVGDHVVNDVEAPRRLGMDAVLIDRRGRRRTSYPTLRRLDQLPALLDGAAAPSAGGSG
ncbi:MAG TPA: HAD family hydrolase [Dehalococcoidia bacterium]